MCKDQCQWLDIQADLFANQLHSMKLQEPLQQQNSAESGAQSGWCSRWWFLFWWNSREVDFSDPGRCGMIFLLDSNRVSGFRSRAEMFHTLSKSKESSQVMKTRQKPAKWNLRPTLKSSYYHKAAQKEWHFFRTMFASMSWFSCSNSSGCDLSFMFPMLFEYRLIVWLQQKTTEECAFLEPRKATFWEGVWFDSDRRRKKHVWELCWAKESQSLRYTIEAHEAFLRHCLEATGSLGFLRWKCFVNLKGLLNVSEGVSLVLVLVVLVFCKLKYCFLKVFLWFCFFASWNVGNPKVWSCGWYSFCFFVFLFPFNQSKHFFECFVFESFRKEVQDNVPKKYGRNYDMFPLTRLDQEQYFSRSACLGKRSQPWQIPSETKSHWLYERSPKKPMKTTEADGLLSKFLQTRPWGQVLGSVFGVEAWCFPCGWTSGWSLDFTAFTISIGL